MAERIIYLNNAATSWPKPEPVVNRVLWALKELNATPGRGGTAAASERVLFEAREVVAGFIGAGDSSRVIFTSNATAALNLAICGLLRSGDHVVTTSMDHNSVARPLARMEDTVGIEVSRVGADREGSVTADSILDAVRPHTALVILTHASNVTGTIQPVEEVGRRLRELEGKRPRLLVDAAQSAGILPIDVRVSGIDLLAVPGHKALYGPAGTGFLYIADDLVLDPLLEGGTGGRSTLRRQPDLLPERYESGTPNLPGIAGLAEAVKYVSRTGIDGIRRQESSLAAAVMEGLQDLPGVTLYGPCDPERQVAVISFRVDGLDPAEVSGFLEEVAGVQVRVGLHCSPFSHQTIGTYPEGTVRVSPGLFSTQEDIRALLDGLRQMLGMRRK
ncbi:MAG: aminotransferase class V-fold PLP-dependent enzyme [bacterium]|nr:MAG: aminotransferase class V-fold PLP-dependent enzyme [bacterium]